MGLARAMIRANARRKRDRSAPPEVQLELEREISRVGDYLRRWDAQAEAAELEEEREAMRIVGKMIARQQQEARYALASGGNTEVRRSLAFMKGWNDDDGGDQPEGDAPAE